MPTQQRQNLESVRLRPGLYAQSLPVPHAGPSAGSRPRPIPFWPDAHTQLQGWIGMHLIIQQAWQAWADNTLNLTMAIWRLNSRAMTRFMPRSVRRPS